MGGGELGNFNFSKYHSNFNLSPSAGYFIASRTAVGASVYLGFQKFQTYYGKEKITGLGLNPFIHQYIFASEKSSIFLAKSD